MYIMIYVVFVMSIYVCWILVDFDVIFVGIDYVVGNLFSIVIIEKVNNVGYIFRLFEVRDILCWEEFVLEFLNGFWFIVDYSFSFSQFGCYSISCCVCYECIFFIFVVESLSLCLVQ